MIKNTIQFTTKKAIKNTIKNYNKNDYKQVIDKLNFEIRELNYKLSNKNKELFIVNMKKNSNIPLNSNFKTFFDIY